MKNRIVEIKQLKLGDIADNPRNPKIHPDSQAEALRAVIAEVGWAGVPLVYCSDRRGGELTFVDGHLRKREYPDSVVSVAVTDLTDTEADLLLLAYDPIANMAELAENATRTLLASVQPKNDAILEILADLSVLPFGDTSTDRDGQGVNSTWGQVKSAKSGKVVIDDIEAKLPDDVIDLLKNLLIAEYEQNDRPISETLEAVIVAGVRAIEAGDR